MTTELEFDHPPEGHVALLVYNATEKEYYLVRGSTTGALKVTSPDWPLPTGAAKESKQLPDGHGVTVDNTDLEVFQDTPESLRTGSHGHAGGAWRRQPLIFGYSGTVSEIKEDENLGTDVTVLDSSPVLEGEVWVLTTITGMILSATITKLEITIVVDGVTIYLKALTPPTSGEWYIQGGEYVLAKDDFVRLIMTTTSQGDDAYLRYCGYRMDIDL